MNLKQLLLSLACLAVLVGTPACAGRWCCGKKEKSCERSRCGKNRCGKRSCSRGEEGERSESRARSNRAMDKEY